MFESLLEKKHHCAVIHLSPIDYTKKSGVAANAPKITREVYLESFWREKIISDAVYKVF